MGSELTLEQLLAKGVSEVGSVKPVEDFWSMLNRRDIDLFDQGTLNAPKKKRKERKRSPTGPLCFVDFLVLYFSQPLPE